MALPPVGLRSATRLPLTTACWWPALCLALAPGLLAADEHAPARFRGSGKADPIRITNVRRTAGPEAGQSTITFDLAWDHSWRAAWDVDAKQHGGPGPLHLESWDAAWVFVKFRPPAAAGHSHAMLSATASDHRAPAGATIDVGRTDDGRQGVGVFVHRAAVGHGPNDFRGIAVRWLHGADAPADADVRVFAVQMVHVPQCRFWAGDGTTTEVKGQFSSGTSTMPFPIESEGLLTLGGEGAETLNTRDGLGMQPSWTDDFNSDEPRPLPAAFPKGYGAFYCMRQEMTQQQYVDFLNTLPYDQQARRTIPQGKEQLGPDAPAGTRVLIGDKNPNGRRAEVRIGSPGIPDAREPVTVQRQTFVASATVIRRGRPAVYETGNPHVACNGIMHTDGLAYAAWAGLRPMTELEFEKACRGPLRPVSGEYAWGTDQIAGVDPAGGQFVLQHAGEAGETVAWEGTGGPDATHGAAASAVTNKKLGGPLRAGLFATPTSDRVAAGGSYWGILDLSGNLMEVSVTVGTPGGRRFAGTHGSGGEPPWTDLFCGLRGGGDGDGGGHYKGFGGDPLFHVSNRYIAAQQGLYGGSRHSILGFRGVRTVRAAPAE